MCKFLVTIFLLTGATSSLLYGSQKKANKIRVTCYLNAATDKLTSRPSKKGTLHIHVSKHRRELSESYKKSAASRPINPSLHLFLIQCQKSKQIQEAQEGEESASASENKPEDTGDSRDREKPELRKNKTPKKGALRIHVSEHRRKRYENLKLREDKTPAKTQALKSLIL